MVLLGPAACFQDIPLSNKAFKTVFCLYEDQGSLLFRKGKNTLGISLIELESFPSSSEASSVFGLLEQATVWRALISKRT